MNSQVGDLDHRPFGGYCDVPCAAVYSEQAQRRVINAAQHVVVEHNTADPAIGCECASLRLDLLSGKDALYRSEQRIAIQQFEVSRELFDAVDLTTPLDFDGNGLTALITAQDVDWADCRHVFATNQAVAGPEGLDMQCQQLLQMRLDTVLDETGISAEFMIGIVMHFVDGDDEPLASLVLDRPDVCRIVLLDAQLTRWGHPIQRLVGTVVGMDRDRAIGLHENQALCRRKMRRQPTRVIDRARGNDKTHGVSVLENRRVFPALDWHAWWFVIGPLFGVAWLGVIGLLLRWTFSRRGSIAGASRRPAAPDAYGHLRPLRKVMTQDEASILRGKLQREGIRSTLANTTDGLYVMVWPADLERARDIANWA